MDEIKEINKYVDLSTLSLNGQPMPIAFLDGIFTYQNKDFEMILKKLNSNHKPGFFFTNKPSEHYALTRWSLNRHGIIHNEPFRNSKGKFFRDVDAKGIGYIRGHPPVFLGVRYPEMENDMELRGLQYSSFAVEEKLLTDEIESLGVRVGSIVALIELHELVAPDGQIIGYKQTYPELGEEPWGMKPVITVRAMGTTSRIQNANISEMVNNEKYAKEIINDAIELVSLELDDNLSPKDYIYWFARTHAAQLALMHSNGIYTDFGMQIHVGRHNLTLDARLLDTHLYDTPKSRERRFIHSKNEVERDPKLAWLHNREYPDDTPKFYNEKERKNLINIDANLHAECVLELFKSVGNFYDVGEHKDILNTYVCAFKENLKF